MYVYIVNYTRKEGHVDGKAEGIYTCVFDASGILSIAGDPKPSTNPSCLAVHTWGHTLYAANEMFEDLCAPHATLSAFSIEPERSLLSRNTVSSEGVAQLVYLVSIGYASRSVTFGNGKSIKCKETKWLVM